MPLLPLLLGAAAVWLLLRARDAAAAPLPGLPDMTRRTPSPSPAPAAGSNQPRGIRNNNPGNLRPGSPWQGSLGSDGGPGGGYLRFDTAANGLRALAKLLRNYEKNGHNTIRKAIARWAPASDNNDTAAYIAAVSRSVGVAPDVPLQLASNPARLAAMVAAIVRHENGVQPYSSAQIEAAVKASA